MTVPAQALDRKDPLWLDSVFEQGDFSLVSSDGCIFRVDAAEVESKESDLRQAIQTCLSVLDHPASITFDQPAPVLQPFLSAMLDDRAPCPSSVTIENFSLILTFAISLHATSVIALLRPILPAYLRLKRADPYYIFTSAVRLSDWQIAGQALAKHSKDFMWYRDHSADACISAADRALGCRPGTFGLDPSGMPYHFWMELPKKVAWALVRACGERKSWKERGERFEVLMRFVEDKAWPRFAAMEENGSDGARQPGQPSGEELYISTPTLHQRHQQDESELSISSRRKRKLERKHTIESVCDSPRDDLPDSSKLSDNRPRKSGKTLPGSNLPSGHASSATASQHKEPLFLPYSSQAPIWGEVD